ncbi:MAG: branched-chain alpha-keto acid dehydrogenase subunit E2, partial [Lysobacteraceae bacterium]
MADLKEALVPDIGDYSDVPVIEILVAVGDTVAKDQGLVTLESDKATLEVPAPFAGVVKELKVKLGDTLSEGSVVAMIEAADGEAAKPAPAAAAAPAAKAEVATAETGAKVAPVAVAAQPDKIAQREIAQEQSAPTTQAAAPQVVDSKPGLDPEASPPHSPPVEFNADSVLPQKVPHASPSVRLFARELGVDLTQVKGSERAGRIS